ncbi:MAG: M23 family metallopeptidase [Pseudomonadota bacterium]
MLSRSRRRIQLGSWACGVLVCTLLGAVGGAFWAGTQVEPAHLAIQGSPTTSPNVEKILTEQSINKEEVARAVRTVETGLDHMAKAIGDLRARTLRLDAMGERLVRLAGLSAEEFSFDDPPALGGPHDGAATSLALPDAVSALELLTASLEDRQPKFSALEAILLERDVQWRVKPSGRPVLNGWMSSHYGWRVDPVSGRRAHHNGLDFAARPGTEIYAVAAGMVTMAETQSGYGNLVEISHGKGYRTRYAHNQKNLVKVGQTVSKGQAIALVGTTGRSTGPHLHFEVIKDGKTVDPLAYVKAQ